MNILVTGASGFIGGYIVKQLAKNASFSIIGLGRSPTTVFDDQGNVQYMQADLTQYLPDILCDVCIHCAGLANDNSTKEQFDLNNVYATNILLHALNGCKTFIYISSSSVYDFTDEKTKSENDANINSHISLYGLSKLKSEELLLKSSIPSVYILRPRAVYGPGDRILLPRILKLIGKNRIIAPGSLEVLSNLTHVQNLYEAIEAVILNSTKGIHIFNIADDYIYNLKDVFAEIAYNKYGHKNFIHIPIWLTQLIISTLYHLGKRSTITHQSFNYLTQNSVMSIAKAKRCLNYKGACNFFENIHQLELGDNNNMPNAGRA